MHLFIVVFNQSCWSAPYRKPTRLLTNLSALQHWGPLTWPAFDDAGSYLGPIRTICNCEPSISLARTTINETFRTSATSIYPEPMDRTLAQAILADLQHQPSPAKEGRRLGRGFWTPRFTRRAASGRSCRAVQH